MAKLIILFVCVTLLEVASAFNCFYCQSKFAVSCDNDIKNWLQVDCYPSVLEDKETVCATITYKEMGGSQQFTKRSCEIVDKGVTNRCTVTNAEEVTCTTCTTDLCNSASNVYLSGFALTGLLAAYLLPKFSM